jgi:predicted DNA-binding antitoxin AbrB/MazE fold protein
MAAGSGVAVRGRPQVRMISPRHRGTLRDVKPVEASYENGLLRPAKPLPLGEGEHVRLIIARKPDPTRWDIDKIAAAAREEDVELAGAGLEQWAADLDAEDAK